MLSKRFGRNLKYYEETMKAHENSEKPRMTGVNSEEALREQVQWLKDLALRLDRERGFLDPPDIADLHPVLRFGRPS
jgi:hypothetical protein